MSDTTKKNGLFQRRFSFKDQKQNKWVIVSQEDDCSPSLTTKLNEHECVNI
jgi:hypothetical protein